MKESVAFETMHKTILAFVLFTLLTLGLLAGCAGSGSGGSMQPGTSADLSSNVQDTAAGTPNGQNQALPENGATSAESAPEVAAGDIDATVANKLAQMTVEEKVAQLFVARAESFCSDGSTLTYVDDDVRSNVAKYPVGGICFLSDNLVDSQQTKQLMSELQAASQANGGVGMLLCVDEEGGTVARIGSNPAFGVKDAGDMRVIGEAGDTAAAKQAALSMGGYVRDLGFNVDFAPVADVDTDQATTMDERSFGTDPDLVASMVVAQVEGFNEAGILCSAKHFPGIGSAGGDSHEEGITLDKGREQLMQEDLVPFKAAIDAGVPMIMVGHISCPQITGDDLPATFSTAVMTGLLRTELGFEGVVITDSLGMGAATQVYGETEASLKAFRAGADMLLLPYDLDAAYNSILNEVKQGGITEDRLNESVSRILKMKLAHGIAIA